MSEILNEPASDNRSVIEEFLRCRGAADMAHPGGMLLEHLIRVRRRLADGGARPDVFRDRFAAADLDPDTEDLRAFLDIRAADEPDVFEHTEDLATRYGPGVYRLLQPVHAPLSAAGREAVRRDLGARTADS